ncbi:glycosyl hydrolase family 28-related protein [Chimaeribacter arupi]|uniref:glycosyl hydrolase family 28-related protein n=1 Tax=Chimaeribacter arupi TaxID=2060066 RepID=UPI0027120477|nr:glycosyl hydrolase family 28-related protein [Chimaeribacter arupi]WKZ93627.1 glycosyl hydrolase family 28-related protein [Chimaeribacter arupi]
MSLLRVDQLSPNDSSIVVNVADIVSSDSGLSASGVKMPAPDNRTLSDWVNDYVSVKSFGAKGDGTTDDSAAFSLAYASGKPIFIPYGTYKITKLIGSLTDGSSPVWEGNKAKILLSGSGGFQVSGQGWSIKGIDFIPVGNVPFAIKTGTVGDNHRAAIHNCNFYTNSENASNYFSVAVDLYACWYMTISNCYLRNYGTLNFGDTAQGIGIQTSYCVNMSITNTTIGSFNKGYYDTGAAINSHKSEGIFFNSCLFVKNNYHIDITDGLYFNILGNMIDLPLSGGYPIRALGAQHLIEGNWIIAESFPVIVGNGTQYGDRHIIRNNQFGGLASGGTSLLAIQNTNYVSITGNKFFQGSQAVGVVGAASYVNFTDNDIVNVSDNAYNLSLATQSTVGRNKVVGTKTSRSVSSSTHVIPVETMFESTFTAAAIASGSGANVTVAVSPGIFTNAPDYANLVTSTGMQIIARYAKSSSTATSLVFNIVASDAAVTAGTYPCYVSAGSITDAR